MSRGDSSHNGGCAAPKPPLAIPPHSKLRGFLAFSHERYLGQGFEWAEMSWTLENNDMVNRSAELIGGARYKTYRMYEKRVERTAGNKFSKVINLDDLFNLEFPQNIRLSID